MQTMMVVLQVVVALVLLNVWLLRASRSTAYRGGTAGSMKEEFAAYGLPDWMRVVVGTLKVAAALSLLLGIWLPVLVLPAALVIVGLMLGALAMHLKIGDPLMKSLPAAGVLALALALCWGATR